MTREYIWTSKYFYGHEVSAYGLENGYVDYHTLASAFDAVLNNSIMAELESKGFYFEQESGFADYSDEIEQAREEIENRESHISDIENELESMADTDENETGRQNRLELIETLQDEIRELENQIDEYESAETEPDEIYQYFIVSSQGAEILERFGEIVFYNDDLDIYIWGVTHWGTSWDYVLTNIKLELDRE